MRALWRGLVGIGLLGSWGVGCTEARPRRHPVYSFESGGVTRTAYVQVPDVRLEEGLPVVFMFHGGEGSEREYKGIRYVGNWAPYFDEEVIYVFPNGIGGGVENRAWWGPEDKDPYRDVTMVEDLIDALDEDYDIDRQKLYSSGFSNGGAFNWFLMCVRPEVFQGFGIVSMTLPYAIEEVCQPTVNRPVLRMQGTDDTDIPWEGNSEVMPAERSLDYLVDLDACDPRPDREVLPDRGDRTTVLRRRYTCENVPAIEHYEIQGGGHSWPSYLTSDHDAVNRSHDVDAAGELLRFWKEDAGL